MRLLAFDSSLDKTYITLALQSDTSDKISFISQKIKSSSNKYHSAYLVSQIKGILKDNLVDINALDAIAVNIGPGSFTGIRVCLTVAKVIAQQLNTRLLGISSCEILSKSLTNKKPGAVLMDAKRDMFYYYNPYKSKKIYLILRNELVQTAKALQNEGIDIVSDSSVYSILKQEDIETTNYEEQNWPLGDTLATIAINEFKGGIAYEKYQWNMIKPLYVQTPPINDQVHI